jgi:exonuclease VII large subunit
MAARTGAGRYLENILFKIFEPIADKADSAEQLEYELRHNTANQHTLNKEELDKIKSTLDKIKKAIIAARAAERATWDQKAFVSKMKALYKTAKTALMNTGFGMPAVGFADANEIVLDLSEVTKDSLENTAENLSRIVVTIPKNIENIERLLKEQEENFAQTTAQLPINDPLMKKWVVAKKENNLVEFWKASKAHRIWVNNETARKKYNLITQEARLRGMYPISLD